VNEQDDELIDGKPNQKGQPGGNAGMADMRPIVFAPPLGNDEGDKERNAGVGDNDHNGIQQGIAAGEGINPVRYSLIHLYRSLSLCLIQLRNA
jgi:hypothetical protein